MKPHRLYIIMCILSLLSFAGCRDEEPVQSAESKRTITVNLGIAMSRVVLDDTDLGDDSQPTDMKVWIFEHGTGNRLAYITETQPVFSGSDALGELVNTKEYVVEVENEIQALDFYVVLNSENGTGLNLEEAATPSQIKEATFTGVKANLKDNQVPAYGCLENFDVSKHRNSYDVPAIKLTRAVGKLELFFTKENENAYLKINKIELEQMPDIGYLKNAGEGETQQVAESYTDEIDNLLDDESGNGLEIETSLPESEDTQIGHFSDYEDKFTKLKLTHTYLLENLNGDTWTAIDNNKDYIYPTIIEDEETRYKMTVFYQTSTNGTEKEQVVYLPAIERNVWNKIFVRVKDDGFAIALNVLPWEEVEESDIGWNGNTPVGSNAPLVAWRLLSGKIEPDHENAKNGDAEAKYCYVLNPRYTSDDDHIELEEHSAYAGFYFRLNEPEGAVWKAHLSNPDYFAFGTGTYNIDGDDEHERRCVSTGRARDEAYQIQIYAKYPWTEGTDFDGNVNAKFTGLKEVKTEFWITITLVDGTEYELVINPNDSYVDETYYYNNRRFAGTDTRITIWQLRALNGYAYDDLMDYYINNGDITNPWWTGEGDID